MSILSKKFGAYMGACVSGVLGFATLWAAFPEKGFECGTGMVLSAGSFLFFLSKTSPLDVVFENCGLVKNGASPQIRDSKQKDGYVQHRFKMPPGLCVDDVIEKQKNIEEYLGKTCEIFYTYKEMVINVYDESLPTRIAYRYVRQRGNVEFPVGVNIRHIMKTIDLADNEPHCLIAGCAGSGKSTLMRTILVNFVIAGLVQLYLVDLKRGVEFRIFENCRNVKEFAKDIDAAKRILSDLSAEVDFRYNKFYEEKVKDIKGYHQKGGKMPYIVLVVDEYADLGKDPEAKKDLITLSQKARACGIHLLCATQRPDANVFAGEVKANFSVIIGLKTNNAVNSKIIIDRGGLEDLRGKGHALVIYHGEEEEVQVPNLEENEAEALVKPYYVDKTEKENDGGVITPPEPLKFDF